MWPEGKEESTGSGPTTQASRRANGRLRRKTAFRGPWTRPTAVSMARVEARAALLPRRPPAAASHAAAPTHPAPLPRSESSSVWRSQYSLRGSPFTQR